MRRKIAPFPLHLMLDHPRILVLPAAAFGMLSRLVFYYWQSECRPLPSSSDELRAVMRAHFPTFKAHKAELLSIFSELEPELERSFRAYKNRRENTIRLGQQGNAIRKLKAIERQASRAPASELAPPKAPHKLRPPAPAPELPASRSSSGAWHE